MLDGVSYSSHRKTCHSMAKQVVFCAEHSAVLPPHLEGRLEMVGMLAMMTMTTMTTLLMALGAFPEGPSLAIAHESPRV